MSAARPQLEPNVDMRDSRLSSRVRGIVRWFLLSVCVASTFGLLKHAAFCYWVSGGPPTSHPTGWARLADAMVFFAFATLATFYTLWLDSGEFEA